MERHVADLLGHEAAIFCSSGTMTNQLGLRTLLFQPPHSVLLDARSHVNLHECGGLAYHSQASTIPVLPKNGRYLTLEDISPNILTFNVHHAVTKVISLENTLNGMIMPLEEIKRISQFAKENNIKMHLDGARLWNASQETGIPMSEYGKYFDTVSVCLSKGVGAPIGSMLTSTKENIDKARHLRKLLGGGWRQAGILAASAKYCIDNVVPTMPETHRLTRSLASHLESLGMELHFPCETNMIFLNTAKTNIKMENLAEVLMKEGIRISPEPGKTCRIVLHYQVTEQDVEKIKVVATRLTAEIRKKNDGNDIETSQNGEETAFYPK